MTWLTKIPWATWAAFLTCLGITIEVSRRAVRRVWRRGRIHASCWLLEARERFEEWLEGELLAEAIGKAVEPLVDALDRNHRQQAAQLREQQRINLECQRDRANLAARLAQVETAKR